MLSLSKKTDYALIALAYLAGREGGLAPAREIARAYDLPLPLLMNILKDLHAAGLVASVRGTKGGYRLTGDPYSVTLYRLIEVMDGPVRMTECAGPLAPAGPPAAVRDVGPGGACCAPEACRVSRACPLQAPLRALHHKLVRFFKDVKLADLILPGRRIDVPLEFVGTG